MAKFLDALGNLAASWQLGIGGARLRSNAGTVEARSADNTALAGFAASQVRSPSISAVGTRQTVLNGSVDGSGFPNALSAGSGLAVTLTATGTACLLSFAAGFDGNGAVDYAAQFTTNQTFSSLTASTTCFLYVDRDMTAGTLTTGFATLAPVYQTIAPSSPATGQHWFDLSSFTMKRWSGSAWVVFQRVFVGEALTGASTVTSVVTYAYRGFYQSAWTAVTTNTTYNFNHNLGLPIGSGSLNLNVLTSVLGSDADSIVGSPSFYFSAAYYGYSIYFNSTVSVPRKNIGITTGDGGSIRGNANTFQTTGYYKLTVSRGW